VFKAFFQCMMKEIVCIKRCLQLFIKLIRAFFIKTHNVPPPANNSPLNSALLTKYFNVSNAYTAQARTSTLFGQEFCCLTPILHETMV